MKSGNFKEYLILLVSITLIVTSCRSDKSRKPQSIDRDGMSTTETLEEINQIKKVYHLCPSPTEMLEVIDVANLEFDKELPNPMELSDKYLDTWSITLNLGVYITDLAYCASFGRHEETVGYLEVLQNIAEKIHVSEAINQELIKRVQQNVESLDSLFKISNEAFINILHFCEKNQRYNTIVLISSGAFIESLYLAIKMAGEFNPESYLVQHLADQKFVLDNLMAHAESYSDDPDVLRTIEDLKPIKNIYEQLEQSEATTTITKDNSNRLVIAGGTKINLSEEDYNKLLSTTIQIRNKITRNENN